MRILLCSAAAALLSTGAFAADIPLFNPPPAMLSATPIAYNWSGFYIGLHAGYGWADGDDDNGESSGALVGGQMGANWQWDQFVLGAEVDASWVDLDSTDWLASARLRAGLAWDRILLYGTGGVASDFDDGLGWVAGAGAEFLLTQNVTLGAEYLHYDVGDGDADVIRARVNVAFSGL
jgi:outer membrane immunogenic protein